MRESKFTMNRDISPSRLAAFGLPTSFSSSKHSSKSNYSKKPKVVSKEACDHFNKKYEIVFGNVFLLPKTDAWFIEPKWKIDKFQELKNKLNNVKSNLNMVQLKSWHQHTNFVNRSSKVIPYVKRFIKPHLTTQAWCKFHEILHTYNLIPLRQKLLTSVHLCEAPGAFITSLNHYLKLHQSFVQWDWIANTLNPHHEGNSFSEMISDDRFILRTHGQWYFGPDYVGDILTPDFVTHFTQHVKHKACSDVLLITADGSFDCQGNPGEQEILVGKLHYREVHLALSILQNGGSFVLKLFTIFESDTICLMYLLCCVFQHVNLFKPASSKEGNSEIYVISLGFNRTQAETANVVSGLSRAFDQECGDRILFGLESVPSEFIDNLYQGVLMFTNWQTEAIERNLSLYKENVRTNPLECARLDKLQVEIAEMFLQKCELRPLPGNMDIAQSKTYIKHTLSLDGRIESGSYKERLEKEHITRTQYVLEELMQIDTQCASKPQIRWIEDLREFQYTDHISIVKGRPIRVLNSSIFVLSRLFKLLYEMKRELKERNVDTMERRDDIQLNERLVLSVLEDNNISTMDSRILSFTADCDLSSSDVTSSHIKLLELLLNSLNELSEHQSLLLVNVPLLTQFSVSVVVLLAGSLFEKVGFIEIHGTSESPHSVHAILLDNKISTNTACLAHILNESKQTLISSNGERSVLSMLPVPMICEHRYLYRCLFEINCCVIKSQLLFLIQSLPESVEEVR